jgi:hypothetical protein
MISFGNSHSRAAFRHGRHRNGSGRRSANNHFLYPYAALPWRTNDKPIG